MVKTLIKINFLFSIFIFASCLNIEKSKKPTIVNKRPSNLVNCDLEIKSFVNNFMQDSIFRMKHISFPLEGYNSDYRFEDENYIWDEESWLFYSSEDFNDNEEVTKSVEIFEDCDFNILLYKKNTGYKKKYQFQKSQNGYTLIFYSYSVI
ncbi:hypothetical protein [Zunongwangia pacifica]|uniref:Lipoprotein n=1 Tax=Zunongwangia pacifica TaxID=2911062 RepID=A0A9X1ZVL9_9FLAO|nr:hypothetical protein [Zunongwangia pacifica]MCL6220971.1 hypothetical protein [Zunongwangia pacifica]